MILGKKSQPDSSILKDLCMGNIDKFLDLANLIVAKWLSIGS